MTPERIISLLFMLGITLSIAFGLGWHCCKWHLFAELTKGVPQDLLDKTKGSEFTFRCKAVYDGEALDKVSLIPGTTTKC